MGPFEKKWRNWHCSLYDWHMHVITPSERPLWIGVGITCCKLVVLGNRDERTAVALILFSNAGKILHMIPTEWLSKNQFLGRNFI